MPAFAGMTVEGTEKVLPPDRILLEALDSRIV